MRGGSDPDPTRLVKMRSGYMVKIPMKDACEHVLLSCWEALVLKRQEFKKLSKTNNPTNDNGHNDNDRTSGNDAAALQPESDVAADSANQRAGSASVKRIQASTPLWCRATR